MSESLTPGHLIHKKSDSTFASAGNLPSCKTATQKVVGLVGWSGFTAFTLSWKALFGLADHGIGR